MCTCKLKGIFCTHNDQYVIIPKKGQCEIVIADFKNKSIISRTIVNGAGSFQIGSILKLGERLRGK